MASTITRKRVRSNPRRREPRVGDMTHTELRDMLIDTLSELLSDPDAGLELRPEIVESIKRQRAEYAAGKRGKSPRASAGSSSHSPSTRGVSRKVIR